MGIIKKGVVVGGFFTIINWLCTHWGKTIRKNYCLSICVCV